MTSAEVLYSFAIQVARLGCWLVLLCAIFVPLEYLCGERRPRVIAQEFLQI